MPFALKFFFDVLSTPALLVGIISLIGLLAQKKQLSDVIKGTLKTILGFLVLGGGAGILVGSLNSFDPLFQSAFALQGVVPNNEAITSLALVDYGTNTALIMVFAMLINILLARFTPMKYIFLTGHHTLFMAALIAVILTVGGLDPVLVIAIGSVLLGVVMVLFPTIAQWVMRKITGGDDLALGHFGTTGYIVSALIGKAVGKNSKSTEEMDFPKGFMFFRDSSVAISITMLVIFLVVAVVAVIKNGVATIETDITGGQNFIVYCIIQSMTFAAGIYVVLAGVRLLIGEIVPAFKGIGEKLVPNAKPALDCPIVFPYAPNAVIIGFLFSFLGGVVGLALCGWWGLTLILPGVIPHFFCGGTAGVFGNATGGRRGAMIGSFVHGLVITFLPIALLPVLGSLGFGNTTFGDADFGVVGIILGNIVRIFAGS